MRKYICVLLVGIMALSSLAACMKAVDAPPSSPESGSQSETVSDADGSSSMNNTNQSEETFEIETPYAVLHYPQQWQEQVQTTEEKGEPYSLKFAAGEAHLFDLSFGGTEGALLGTLKTDAGNIILRLTSYEIDEGAENYHDLCAMQEDINVILQGLAEDYDFAIGEELIEEDNSTFEIKTSLTTLYYPQKWQDSVNVDTSDIGVSFTSKDGDKLFDLEFGDSEGYLLGKYKDTELHIISYEIEKGDRTDEEMNRLYAMQEDVNVILQHLMEDENFTLQVN